MSESKFHIIVFAVYHFVSKRIHRECVGSLCWFFDMLSGLSIPNYSFHSLEPTEPSILPSEGSIASDDHRTVTASVGSKVNAFQGTTIKITCGVKGVPEPEVTWTRDGKAISSDERVGLDSNGTLIIRDSSVEDSGDYTCEAKSRAGQTSASSSVNIASKA